MLQCSIEITTLSRATEGKAMSETTWKTKWGSRRVRQDPPTLAEAIAAAQGLTEDPRGQVQIAAELMGVTPAEAKAEMQRVAPDRRLTRLVSTQGRDKGARMVVVERKASRRVLGRSPSERSLPRY